MGEFNEMSRFAKTWKNEDTNRSMLPMEGMTEKDEHPAVIKNFLDSIAMRKGQSPSANGACSARGLAKLGV